MPREARVREGVADRYAKRRGATEEGARAGSPVTLMERLQGAREILDSLMLLEPEEERALARDFIAKVAELRRLRARQASCADGGM